MLSFSFPALPNYILGLAMADIVPAVRSSLSLVLPPGLDTHLVFNYTDKSINLTLYKNCPMLVSLSQLDASQNHQRGWRACKEKLPP